MVSKRELVNVGELGLIEASKNASSSMGLKALPFSPMSAFWNLQGKTPFRPFLKGFSGGLPCIFQNGSETQGVFPAFFGFAAAKAAIYRADFKR